MLPIRIVVWLQLEVIRFCWRTVLSSANTKECCIEVFVFARWQHRSWGRFAVSDCPSNSFVFHRLLHSTSDNLNRYKLFNTVSSTRSFFLSELLYIDLIIPYPIPWVFWLNLVKSIVVCAYISFNFFVFYYKSLCSHNTRSRFFAERVINVWNCLPPSVDYSTLATFRRSIDVIDFTSSLKCDTDWVLSHSHYRATVCFIVFMSKLNECMYVMLLA